MIHTINTKALELYHRIADKTRSEAGQTTSEYVAVTAVAVAIAFGVLYTALSGSLTTAIGTIGDKIESWASGIDGTP